MVALVPFTLAGVPARGLAQGHGPIFGLSTPTLGQGGWGVDVMTMARVVGGETRVMLRPMVSYGITQDVQLSASVPMPLYTPQGVPPARGTTRMPATPDGELMLGWRFQRHATGIGARFESTAYLGFDYPTDAVRAGMQTSPGLAGALVTGYASRSIYVWAGGLYRRYMSPVGRTADHPGDLAMYSLVVGYRPPPFQWDYPKPDWRVFMEVLGEHTAHDVASGAERPNSGGAQIFAGPTLLGLYGAWGVSGGAVFPVYRQLNGTQPYEHVRMAVDLIYWF